MKWLFKLIFCIIKRPKHILQKINDSYSYNDQPLEFNNEFINEGEIYWKCTICGEKFDNAKGK